MITEKKRPKNLGRREKNLLESLNNYTKLKEYKFVPQRVRPKLHSQIVQRDLRKI